MTHPLTPVERERLVSLVEDAASIHTLDAEYEGRQLERANQTHNAKAAARHFADASLLRRLAVLLREEKGAGQEDANA